MTIILEVSENDVYTVDNFNSRVSAGYWKLGIKTRHTRTYDYTKNFLSTEVFVRGISRKAYPLSVEQSIAVAHNLTLFSEEKDISDEPRGYAKLWHKHICSEVKEGGYKYVDNLEMVVKNFIIENIKI